MLDETMSTTKFGLCPFVGILSGESWECPLGWSGNSRGLKSHPGRTDFLQFRWTGTHLPYFSVVPFPGVEPEEAFP